VASTLDAPTAPAADEIAPSLAGPLTDTTAPPLLPPALGLPAVLQTIRFGLRPFGFNFSAQRQLGEVFRVNLLSREDHIVVTSHPDHIKALFTAKPAEAPSLTGESPLRPILGPNSVLTTVGDTHMRQRKLLLPPFHGEAVERYIGMISEAAEREVERWRADEPFALAPRMQAITLDVILAGIFGIEGRPDPRTPEGALRNAIKRLTRLSTKPYWQLVELSNIGRDEPRGLLKAMLERLDKIIYAVIDSHRAAADGTGTDILSLLLAARDEDGRPLTDQELRDELLTLVLAGHETTANSLAWTFERLLRTPAAYDRLREEVRGGDDAYVDATVYEGMRVRPVIPMVARRITSPWQLGDYRLPGGTAVALSILLVHHRADVYGDPFVFRPERFLGRTPGTYTWIPFGGGIRRCLGAALAMAEQQIVLRTVARHTDMVAPDQRAERAYQRNVTMIPSHGARVVVTAKR